MGKAKALLSRPVTIGIGIVFLAAVIFAGAALSSPSRSKGRAELESPAQQAERLAKQADSAASADDTPTALSLAQRALALDAGNKTAQRLVKRYSVAKAPSKPKPSTSTSEAPKPPAPGAYDSKVADIASLLPVEVTNWRRADVVAQGGEAMVSFEPGYRVPEYRTVVRVSYYVHDRGDAEKAKEFIEKVDRTTYGVGGQDASAGSAGGYIGSDGSRLQVFAFARGRYAFECVVNARPGGLDAARPVALSMAALFPAAK